MIMLRMLAFRPGVEEQGRAVEARASTQPPATGKPVDKPKQAAPAAPAAASAAAGDWCDIIGQLGIGGITRELALNCALQEVTEAAVVLNLDKAHVHLLNKTRTEQIEAALGKYYGRSIKLKVLKDAPVAAESPAQQQAREADERKQQAIESIEADENIKAMQDAFGATVSYDSIRPRD
jgi:DNA polymerase-3 subunit gamma/tau